MTQKLLKIGSSAGVTIPKKSLKDLGLKIGDEVNVQVDSKERKVTIEPSVKFDRDLLDWTNNFIQYYRRALEELAQK